MKIRLLTLLSFFSGSTIIAQITITKSDFGVKNDTLLYSIANIENIDLDNTGQNHVWNYSSLTPASQYIKKFEDIADAGMLANINFGQFAANKYKASYYQEDMASIIELLSNVPQVPIESFNRVIKVADDSLTYIGSLVTLQGQNVAVKSDTIETRYHFPMTYGDVHQSRGYSDLDLQPIMEANWIEYRQIYTQVDGFGNLKTPYSNYETIRVHHEIHQIDSFNIDITGSGSPQWIGIPEVITHEYEWFTNGRKDAVMRIVANDLMGSILVTKIEYQDIYHPEVNGINEHDITFECYPNPANNQLNVKSEKLIESYKITSSSGKLIKETNDINSNELTVDIQDVPNGVYFIEIQSKENTSKKYFVKI